jgi:hypothetical protein
VVRPESKVKARGLSPANVEASNNIIKVRPGHLASWLRGSLVHNFIRPALFTDGAHACLTARVSQLWNWFGANRFQHALTRVTTTPTASSLIHRVLPRFLKPKTMSSCEGLGSHCISAKSMPGRNITQSNVSFQPSSNPSPSPVYPRSNGRWETHVAASLLLIVQSRTGVSLRVNSRAWGVLTESQFRQEPKQRHRELSELTCDDCHDQAPQMKTRCCPPSSPPSELRFYLSVWVLHASSP